ncbi:alpha/beta hydrolase [Amycolatopsis ultiminotia]|uniref:Alpha/beta hydrolase n=1 Tax=Amycolatopsis ultiminotia TaxID=543629 RepID=A0ABP6W1F3_9PSEU
MGAEVTKGFLEIDGASIYYERRGAGPALLLIPGGGGAADQYALVADELARDYTVLSMDRRGNARSKWRTPVREFRLQEHASDAVAVIHANGFESATVFGSSGGAAITLAMIAAFPRVVNRAIAHEPPIISGLPNRSEIFDWFDHLEALGVEGKPQQAQDEFIEACGLTDSMAPDAGNSDLAPLIEHWGDGVPYFVNEEMQGFTYFRPDYPRLIASDVPLQVAIGQESANMHGPDKPVFYALAAQRVAARIGAPTVEFPGNHLPFLVDPKTFVKTLRDVLSRPAA